MIKIDSKVQKLRTTLSTIHQELPDRCIANDEQLLDFKCTTIEMSVVDDNKRRIKIN